MSLWNGNSAALSLTFDDALQCQLEFAIPIMNSFDIQGTFFAIGDCQQYPLDVHGWRKVIPFGHEIGSHSVRHRKAATLTPADALNEAKESKRILENHFDVEVSSFCYPYTDAPSVIQEPVSRFYKQARGGRGARNDKYVVPRDGANLFNLPCYHVSNACFENGDAFPWIDEALKRGAWLTLMFHGVGTDGNQWDNVYSEAWMSFMHYLTAAKEHGLWVAPFGVVAENLRRHQ